MEQDFSIKKVAKASVGYTVGNILIKGINFISLPIFVRVMTAEEFGIYNIFLSYDAILFVIIGFAMHSCIRSANQDFKEKISEFISSITLLYIFNLMLLCIISILFGSYLTNLLGVEQYVLIMLICFSFGSSVITLYNNYLALEYSYKKYLVIAATNSIGNILISFLLMFTFFRNDKAYGRIAGVTITAFIVSIFIILYFYRKAKPRINKQYWKYALKYSWPIVPHGISQVLLSQFDRIMIRSLVGITEVGLYSLPYSLKSILLIIVESLSTTWTTWVYEKLEKNNVEKIQNVSKYLMMIFVILTVGMLALIPELIYILGGNAYNESKYVAIPIIIEAFVIALYNIVVPIEYYTKKTHFIMSGTMLAAILNVVLNYFFIKKYGYVAAAYTTLFAYLCYLLFHTLISYYLVKFNVLHIGMLSFGFVIVIFSAIMNYLFVEDIIVRYLLCVIIVISILLYLYQCGGFNNNERS